MLSAYSFESYDWLIVPLQSVYMVPNTRGFLKIPRNKYLFYRTPSGAKSPTLAELSTSYLASLAQLRPSELASDGFPSYANNLTDGCFPLHDPIAQSRYPSKTIGTRILTLLKLFWFKLKCQFIPRWKQPNHACPFDRRPGEKYWNGKMEGPHDE